MPETTTKKGSALEKALSVLEVALEAARPMTVAEVAERLGLSRQTAHRLVEQLDEAGLLRRDLGRDHFTAGPRLVSISLSALQLSARMSPIRAILAGLVDKVGETCNLGVFDGQSIVYVDRVECDWPLRIAFRPGSRVPVHATAIGKLLLAHMPKRTRQRLVSATPLKRFTANTVTDPEELERQFALIRAQGFAINDQESLAGIVGLAVPVLDRDEQVVAGLSVHAPTARLAPSGMPRILPYFQQAAEQLREEIEALTADDLAAAKLGRNREAAQ